jgi:hypothetical protein
MTSAIVCGKTGSLSFGKEVNPMKQLISLLTVALLLAGTALLAQESKPKTYSLVLAGAV